MNSTTATFEWISTPASEAVKEVTFDMTRTVSVIDVCRDERSGEYVVGITTYVNPKDYHFTPKTFWGSDLVAAEKNASDWANDIAADARWMAR